MQEPQSSRGGGGRWQDARTTLGGYILCAAPALTLAAYACLSVCLFLRACALVRVPVYVCGVCACFLNLHAHVSELVRILASAGLSCVCLGIRVRVCALVYGCATDI